MSTAGWIALIALLWLAVGLVIALTVGRWMKRSGRPYDLSDLGEFDDAPQWFMP